MFFLPSGMREYREKKIFKQLQKSFKRLGKVPQSAVNKAARVGGRIALQAAKANAPEETGDLKSGIILKKERKQKAGKTVYDVLMDPNMNDIFAKVSKNKKRYYYPASQEYGFMTVNGGYVPGFRFLRNALEDNYKPIKDKVVDVLAKEVDKALKKKG